jgi:3-methyladenine DNA glycosylase AlkD
MVSVNELTASLRKVSDKSYSEKVKMFFKTGVGDYAEKDVFLGVKVPVIRSIVKDYYSLSLSDVKKLLLSEVHEFRFSASLILIEKFRFAKKNGLEDLQQEIISFYVKNGSLFNNWDLVDVSAPNILGDYLLNHDGDRRVLLSNLLVDKNIWKRRIAVVSTLKLVRAGQLSDAMFVCNKLLCDEEDLINKAVGWVLREVGKRDKNLLIGFLKDNYSSIPRITFSYAVEKLSIEDIRFIRT